MKYKITLWLLSLLWLCNFCKAQPTELGATAIQYYDVAQNQIKLANYDQAITSMLKAISLSPNNLQYQQELGQLYLVSRQPQEADTIFSKLLKSNLADEVTFQYGAETKIALDDFDAAKSILKEGLENYPYSGILYFTKGNLYNYYKEFKQAINAYEEGISVAPYYAPNYYQAATLQLKNPDNFLATILYAESYIALDPFGERTQDMKTCLYNGYSRLCNVVRTENKIVPHANVLMKGKSRAMEKKMLEIIIDNKNYIMQNNNVKNLNRLRTKFIVEWFREQPVNMPVSLFRWQQRLVSNGLFSFYNQWLFGALENITIHETWLKNNQGNLKDFNLFLSQNAYNPEIITFRKF